MGSTAPQTAIFRLKKAKNTWEQKDKYRSPVKAELKKMHRLKSYGQTKVDTTIIAISHVFLAFFEAKKGRLMGSTSPWSS